MIPAKVIRKGSLNVNVEAQIQQNTRTGHRSIIAQATAGQTVVKGVLNPQFDPNVVYTQEQLQADIDALRDRLADEAAFEEKIRTFSENLT